MTREEAIAILQDEAYFLYGDDAPYNRQAFDMAIQALSQEPCADDLQRALDMEKGAYNALVKNIQCDDAISREDAIAKIYDEFMSADGAVHIPSALKVMEIIRELPSVTHKSGHWIETEYHRWRCSVCREKGMSEWDNIHDVRTNFCPDCGAKMVGPQESEVEE